MMKKMGFGLLLLASVTLGLVGCSGSDNSSALDPGVMYIGKGATNQIIEVQSSDTWKIKDMNKDDSNYTIATVKELNEKVDDYSLIELVSKEIYGDVDSFSRREGRKYILVEDDAGDLYFRSISEDNVDEVTEELGKRESKNEKNEYIIKVAKFEFSRQ